MMKEVKKKLLNKESNVLELFNAKPNEIENPLGKVTIGASIFSLIQIVVFLSWFYWAYKKYMNWFEHEELTRTSSLLPNTSIVKVGIPLFILSIILEYLIGLLSMTDYNSKEQYRLSDTIASFSNGIIQQLIEMWTTLIGDMFGLVMITAIPYKFIYENYGVTRVFEGNWQGFLFMFLARDFCYYWFHRAAHRCAFMWAVHGVHHQPNSFSYHVNLSQGGIQRITSTIFYAPLALFCPPELYTIIFPMEKIYGFFTHTCLVGKSHWSLSLFFVTPSSHRVHHAGAPAKYIDKNYGEMLSIWDKLFGTHQDEEEPIVFGHCQPIDSYEPIYSQFNGWFKIWKKSKLVKSPWKKLLCFIMPPGWDPISGKEFDLQSSNLKNSTPYNSEKYDSQLPNNLLKFYLLIWFIQTLALSIYLIKMYNQFLIPPNASGDYYFSEIIILFCYIIYSLFCFGSISDLNSISIYYDSIRLLLTPLIFYSIFKQKLPNSIIIYISIISLISFLILFSNKDYFKFEKSLEKEKRVWIKEIGRDYTNKLKKVK
ncbi:hypothetical protein ACTFIZ_006538 [Dictyostelium cf. discoideum]